MKKSIKALMGVIAAFSLLSTAPVFGQAAQWCTGKLSYFWVDNSGNAYVYTSWRGDYVQLCNVNSVWKGISIDVCKGWITTARAAVMFKSNTILHYANTSACPSIPAYGSAPSPVYLMLAE